MKDIRFQDKLSGYPNHLKERFPHTEASFFVLYKSPAEAPLHSARAIFDILRQTDIFPPNFGGLGNNVYLCTVKT